jgi:NAD+ synthase
LSDAHNRQKPEETVTDFHKNVLDMDLDAAVDEICARLRELVSRTMLRRGAVVAMSGGIDSSVTSALAVKALGPKKVFGLMLPELDSNSESGRLGELLAKHHGIDYAVEDIAPALKGLGCYERRDEAYRRVFPEYGEGWKAKIVLPGGLLDSDRMNVYRLVVRDPDGNMHEERLPVDAYLQIVAATNFKQRIRKTMEYYHADRLNYAVFGTPNRLEYDQGFFVKNGDGSADIKPIAHLYKTQVYALARHLGLPDEICDVIPTTDTYSLPQGQDEFYFVLPYAQMDLILWAHNHGISSKKVADVMNLEAEQIERVFHDIERKRATTRPLHLPPQLVRKVEEISL